MSDPEVKRPPILAGACLYLGLLSAVIAVRAVTLVSSWNAESRADDVATYLTALRDAGMDAAAAESTYKVFLTVVAVLGAAGAVFAIFTARGDRASRVGMTVTIGAAGLATFLGALGTSFFLAMLGALAVVFTIRLWTGEIRSYFRTLAGHPPPEPKVREPRPAAPGFPAQQAAPVAAPRTPGVTSYPRPDALPRPVAIAGWTALVGSLTALVTAGLWVLVFVVAGVDYDDMRALGGPGADMIRGSESDLDATFRLYNPLMSVALVLAVGGVLAASLVLARRRGVGVFLFVMTMAALLVSFLAFPVGLPWTAAAIVVLVQLRKPEARAWFDASR